MKATFLAKKANVFQTMDDVRMWQFEGLAAIPRAGDDVSFSNSPGDVDIYTVAHVTWLPGMDEVLVYVNLKTAP